MPYAIDLFCGAGGFSEGIIQAGFDIIFSSDKSPMAGETYTNRHKELGLKEGIDTHFELADIKELTSEKIFEYINNLRYGDIFKPGVVDVIFGGPPCQGFSRLGKRDTNDPRNMLFHEYLRIVRDIRPKYVVMENVTGILDMQMLDFPSVLCDERYYMGQNYVKDILTQEFTGMGYTLLDVEILNAANFGVPQQRNRVVFLAYRNDVEPLHYPTGDSARISVYEAFGDLYNEENYNYTTNYSRRSVEGRTPSKITNTSLTRTRNTNMDYSKHDQSVIERFSLYQEGENKRGAINRLKETGINLKKYAPNLFYESLFQVNIASNIKVIKQTLRELDILEESYKDKWYHFTNRQLSLLSRFESQGSTENVNEIINYLSLRFSTDTGTAMRFWSKVKGRINKDMSEDEFHSKLLMGDVTHEMGEAIFTKKGIRTRLNSDVISPTMVTLPDDFIHPYFDRVLTVREMARLQSFDDSFEFLGKRTTGGNKRAVETPQYTQVGNAVPPLLAKAIAEEVYKSIQTTNSKNK